MPSSSKFSLPPEEYRPGQSLMTACESHHHCRGVAHSTSKQRRTLTADSTTRGRRYGAAGPS